MGWAEVGQPLLGEKILAIKLVPMSDFQVITRKVHFNKVLESLHSDLTSSPHPPKKRVKQERACVRREVCKDEFHRPVLGMGQNFLLCEACGILETFKTLQYKIHHGTRYVKYFLSKRKLKEIEAQMTNYLF